MFAASGGNIPRIKEYDGLALRPHTSLLPLGGACGSLRNEPGAMNTRGRQYSDGRAA